MADGRTARTVPGRARTAPGRATLSRCRRYRYRLERALAPPADARGDRGAGRAAAPRPPTTVCFVMLNPSTADARRDDPTLRRCLAFARGLGARRLVVVNLFALRATSPRRLALAADPSGPRNRHHLRRALATPGARVIAAWGAPPAGLAAAHATAVATVRALAAAAAAPLEVLGTTAAGHPRHPLYLRADARPTPWAPAPTTTSGPRRGRR